MQHTTLKVDQWTIRPDINRLETRHGYQSIGPRVMQLLLKLLEKPGEVCTRHELLEVVWDDVIVNEESLTKSISFLRQYFNDGGKDYIETIRAVGYRWIGPEPVYCSVGTPGIKRKKTVLSFSKSRMVALLSLFLLISVTIVTFTSITSRGPDHFELINVTDDRQQERVPRVSPDGMHVLFARQTPNGSMDLYIREIKTDKTERITTSLSIETDPVWSPDGLRIAYYRNNSEDVSIEELDVLTGEQRKLVNVAKIPNLSAISWSPNGKYLAYCDLDENDMWSLYMVNTENLESRRLTTPTKSSYGDVSPRFSPDGDKIAFIRIRCQGLLYKHLIPGFGDVFIYELKGEQESKIYEGELEISGVEWFDDSKRIGLIAVDNYFTFDIASLDTETMVKTNLYRTKKLLRNLSKTPKNNGLVFEEWSERYAVWKANFSENSLHSYRPFLDVADKSWHPQVSHSGHLLVYVSTRSGHNQLWLRDLQGKKDEQLTFEEFGVIRNPRWSPDDRSILYEVHNNLNFDLYALKLEDGSKIEISATERQERNAVWSMDGQSVYFALKDEDDFKIVRKDLQTGSEEEITGAGGFAVKINHLGVFYLSYTDPGIFHINKYGFHDKIIADIDVSDWFNWELSGDKLYYTDRTKGMPHLSRFDLNTRRKTDMSGNNLHLSHVYQGFSIDANSGVIYITVNDYSQSDIKMLAGVY